LSATTQQFVVHVLVALAEIVKVLLDDKRADASAERKETIQRACRVENLQVVKLLLSDKRVDPTAENNHAIRQVCSGGYFETFSRILKSLKC
jgi:hypothetical protein